VDRKTIRQYVAPAVAARIAPGGPAKSEQEWAGLVREWFSELADTRLRQVTWPAIAAHPDHIVAQMKAGVRMSTIWQRLRNEHGLAARAASFRRYGRQRARGGPRPQVVVWSPRPAEAGEQAQIDYELGRWLDPLTGRLVGHTDDAPPGDTPRPIPPPTRPGPPPPSSRRTCPPRWRPSWPPATPGSVARPGLTGQPDRVRCQPCLDHL
jgi:hypothetical protein